LNRTELRADEFVGQCFILFYLSISHDGLILLNVKRRVLCALLAGEIHFVNCPVESCFSILCRVIFSICTVVTAVVSLGVRLVRLRIVRLLIIVAVLYFVFVERVPATPPFV